MKKILITGAKGQLGKKIKELMEKDFELVLTDSDDMDIINFEIVETVFQKEKPDFVIHGAAFTRVDDAEEKEELCRKINADGTKNIAEAAKANNTTVIYISTDYVFDGKKNTPYTEEDQTNPLSVYGRTKFEGEEFIREICERYYIIRSAWIFGELPENHPGTNFVETMLRLAKDRTELNIVDDQVGSPTYTGDLVNIIKEILIKSEARNLNLETNQNDQKEINSNFELRPFDINSGRSELVEDRDSNFPFGTYHFSGEGECSWYDFAKEIFMQKKIEITLNPITSEQYPQKAKRPHYSYMSKEKIVKALGVKVRGWQEMLNEYLEKRND